MPLDTIIVVSAAALAPTVVQGSTLLLIDLDL
jgi:hypothetical protein